MGEQPWGLWRFDGATLAPYAEFDLNLLIEKYAPGTELRGRFAKPRSLPHHRLYWAVLEEVVAATGPGNGWASSEDLHEAIKLHMRMVREVRMMNGGVRFLTRSIAFESMEQGEFRLFFKRAMLAIEESTGINTDELIEQAKIKTGAQL